MENQLENMEVGRLCGLGAEIEIPNRGSIMEVRGSRFVKTGSTILMPFLKIWGRVQKNIALIELIRARDIALKIADGLIFLSRRVRQENMKKINRAEYAFKLKEVCLMAGVTDARSSSEGRNVNGLRLERIKGRSESRLAFVEIAENYVWMISLRVGAEIAGSSINLTNVKGHLSLKFHSPWLRCFRPFQ